MKILVTTDSYTGTVCVMDLEVLTSDARLGYMEGSIKTL